MSVAQVRSLDGHRSSRRFATLLHGHPHLVDALHATLSSFARYPDSEALTGWDDTLLQLFATNLGEQCLLAFLDLSKRWPLERSASELIVIGQAARAVGREAGSREALSLLEALPRLQWRLPAPRDLGTLLGALERLAVAAPEAMPLVLARLDRLLACADAAGVAAWISGGLRSASTREARRAYFSLADDLSKRLLALGNSSGDLTRLERRLAANVVAIWNQRPRFRKLTAADGLPLAKRTSLAGGVIGLPETFPGFDGERADRLYRAAVAHACAHVAYSKVQFPLGQLKPLQVALVSLIEDARVEMLALRDRPGLRRLWLPFHAADSAGPATASGLMMRLARALIDPAYADEDGWVTKGRALVMAAADRLGDPAISREIGGLLGNDLGQMRLQFNARNHVVEPIYRDDNWALWNLGEQPDAPQDEITLAVDSARVERRDDADRRSDDAMPDEAQRARVRAANALEGVAVATYPEWDYAAGFERSDWTSILEADAPVAPHAAGSTLMHDTTAISRRISAMAREAAIGRRIRHKGQREGDTFDIDACIALTAERRAGLWPEARVYQRDVPGPRDLAILLLLDLSQSTADRDGQGRQILAVERDAASVLAAAVDAAGDAIAVHGFNSDGRERVRYVRIKGFDEPMIDRVRSRLAGLASSHSTRLGAALRHAGHELARRRAFRRVLLLLTDGEPSDVDVQDPLYLAEDARRVVQQLRRSGIDSFAFGMGRGPFERLDRIFGARRALRVPRVEVLPERVMQLYAELKK